MIFLCSIVSSSSILCFDNKYQSSSGCWNICISLIGLALYDIVKPNMKLKDVKQPNCSVSFECNINKKSKRIQIPDKIKFLKESLNC